MRGIFPLNGTYFQVDEVRIINPEYQVVFSVLKLGENVFPLSFKRKRKKKTYIEMQVFADHESSLNPINVPRD